MSLSIILGGLALAVALVALVAVLVVRRASLAGPEFPETYTFLDDVGMAEPPRGPAEHVEDYTEART